jgi:uncharacterized protein
MRLAPNEIEIIRKTAAETFGPGAVVRLFGSRLDEQREGGDLDLHIDLEDRPSDVNARASELRRRLSNALDVPKLDILVHADGTSDRPIDRWVRLTGQDLADPDAFGPKALGPNANGRSPGLWTDLMSQTVFDMLVENFLAARAVGKRLSETYDVLRSAFPVAIDQIGSAPLIQRLACDAMLLQVQTLTDLMDRRVFRSLYMIDSKEIAPKMDNVRAFAADRNLVAGGDWRFLIDLRNSLARGYVVSKSKQAETLNECFNQIPLILTVLDHSVHFACAAYPPLRNALPTE